MNLEVIEAKKKEVQELDDKVLSLKGMKGKTPEQFRELYVHLKELIVTLARLSKDYADVDHYKEVVQCAASIVEAGNEIKKVEFALTHLEG